MSNHGSFDKELQVVVFRLGDELYGIHIFRVCEIIKLREITFVPRTKKHVRGLLNLRGKTIPIVDLRVCMSLEAAPDTEATRIIVVETDYDHVGLVVDSVKEVATLKPEQLESVSSLITDSKDDFICGIAKQGPHLVTLLDLDKVLAA
jgi:purine-binding chemotaxis protein CheW